jgi:toxin ParE1/3/4
VRRDNYTIRLLPVAEDDLDEIVSYIAADNLRAAEAVATRIEKSLLHLAVHPHLGRIPNEEELANAGCRYLIVENYLIFYVVEDREIVIHRIIHGARDYRRLL